MKSSTWAVSVLDTRRFFSRIHVAWWGYDSMGREKLRCLDPLRCGVVVERMQRLAGGTPSEAVLVYPSPGSGVRTRDCILDGPMHDAEPHDALYAGAAFRRLCPGDAGLSRGVLLVWLSRGVSPGPLVCSATRSGSGLSRSRSVDRGYVEGSPESPPPRLLRPPQPVVPRCHT